MPATEQPRSSGSLYHMLDVELDASDAEIRTAYRRLALRFHPDKNPGDSAAEEKFKAIQHAYATLSDASKRAIYDKYGSVGLKLADQIGPERFRIYMLSQSPWVKCCSVCVCLSTGCCCCCFFCFFCCCDFCCGFCRPEPIERHEPSEEYAEAWAGTPAPDTGSRPASPRTEQPQSTSRPPADSTPLLETKE